MPVASTFPMMSPRSRRSLVLLLGLAAPVLAWAQDSGSRGPQHQTAPSATPAQATLHAIERPESTKEQLSPPDRQLLEHLQHAATTSPQRREGERAAQALTTPSGSPTTTSAAPPWMTAPNATSQEASVLLGAAAPVVTSQQAAPTRVPRLYVFISLGMPEAELRALLQQGAGDPEIVYVLRGYEPPHLTPLLRRLAEVANLTQQTLDAGAVPNVIIDPTLFSGYEVDRVPVFLGRVRSTDNSTRWYRIVGAISIPGAEELLAADRGSRTTQYGPTYAIAEPDLLLEIEKRTAQVDWEKAAQGAAERLVKMPLPGLDLPTVNTARVRHVDPTVVAQRDIALPDGRLAVTKGARVNPLDHLSLAHDYIVFDGTDERQVRMVRELAAKSAKPVFLMTSRFPQAQSNQPLLHERVGQPVYALTTQVIARLQIAALPTLIQQDGQVLKLTEMPPGKSKP